MGSVVTDTGSAGLSCLTQEGLEMEGKAVTGSMHDKPSRVVITLTSTPTLSLWCVTLWAGVALFAVHSTAQPSITDGETGELTSPRSLSNCVAKQDLNTGLSPSGTHAVFCVSLGKEGVT